MQHLAPHLARLFLVTIVASVTTRAYAQGASPGSRVRVTPIGAAQPIDGSLVAMNADTISLHLGLSSTLITMPMDSVRSVDLSHGRFASFGSIMRDGAIGLVAGVGTVVLIGKGLCRHDANTLCGVNTAVAAVPVGVIGFLGGVAIGRSHRKEQWERLYDRPPSAALLVGPAAHGFVIGMAIPFGSSH